MSNETFASVNLFQSDAFNWDYAMIMCVWGERFNVPPSGFRRAEKHGIPSNRFRSSQQPMSDFIC